MMKIGIESGAYLGRYGFDAGLARMKAHGYECLDYQDFANTDLPMFGMNAHDFEAYLTDHRKKLEDAGIEVTQTHGPWRWPPQDFTEEDRAERFDKMARSIVGTAILGCKNFVIHPIMPFGDNQDPDPAKLWEMNYEFMGRLVEVGRQNDVVVCFENMPMRALSISVPEAILKFVKTINSPYFKVCLDTGHCSVFGLSPAEAVRLTGKDYLQVLHVHDNDGHGDLHWLPYTGVIDWDDFSNALEEIGYEGSLSLETAARKCDDPAEMEAREKDLFLAAKKLARR